MHERKMKNKTNGVRCLLLFVFFFYVGRDTLTDSDMGVL